MKIRGSVALVTGSDRVLGRALVSALVEAGADRVYAAAREVSRVTVSDPRVVPIALDTSKPEQIGAAARAAGDVTLLVNNAGVSDPMAEQMRALWLRSPKEYERAFAAL